LDDDGQEDTHQDKRIKQRWNVKLLQHGQDRDMLPYSPSPQQCRSHTKSSAQKKRSKKTRREKTGRSVSCNKGGVRMHVQGRTVASSILSSIKSPRTARRRKTTTKEMKLTMKPQLTKRRQALEVVVSLCPPLMTIARVALILQWEKV
jgi:hypothetical protein